MAKSLRFRTLEARIKQLEKHLLPNFRPSGNYSKKEQDLTKSFRLLVHAEIESYFEDRALAIAIKALDDWKSRNKATKALFSMGILAINMDGKPRNTLTRAHLVVNEYKEIIKGNHGIKTDNLKKILLPIGFVDADFDNTWLNTVDSWAGLRGEVAHAHFKTHQQIDPQSELTTVNLIVGGIVLMDEVLSKI
ncbi:MAG: HEPN domain-containing protein [Janthinobacterium lividum]